MADTSQIVLDLILQGQYGQELRVNSAQSRKELKSILFLIKRSLPKKVDAKELGIYYANDLCEIHGKASVFYRRPNKSWLCLDCEATYDKKRNSDPARKQQQTTRNRNRRHNRKTRAIGEYGCRICGYNKTLRALHFHHDEPTTKKFQPFKVITHTEEAFRKEVAKCTVLCARCHAEVELNKYLNRERTVLQGTPGFEVNCETHGKDSPGVKRNKRNSAYCAYCKQDYLKQLKLNKKQELIALLGSKCGLCDYCHPPVLQFHHLDRKEKKFALSQALFINRSLDILTEEAKKCILLCPNCHVEVEEGMHDKWLAPIVTQYKKLKDSSKIKLD